MRICGVWQLALISALAIGCGGSAPESNPDGGAEDSGPNVDGSIAPVCAATTYEAIQQKIFKAHGCTSSACHGQSADTAEGGLDLRPAFAYESLMRVASQIEGGMQRVFPGSARDSLLFVKLVAKFGDAEAIDGIEAADIDLDARGLGQAMPVGLPALEADELDLVREWIKAGAPREGVVLGTEGFLTCDEIDEIQPNKIPPLPVPAPADGLQFYSGAWHLPAEREDEVCFATYYDFSDIIPESARSTCPANFDEGQECFAYGYNELAQDGQSHHSIIGIYHRMVEPVGGGFDGWACLGGDSDGQPCDPTTRGVCGERGQCGTPVETGIACGGYPHAPQGFGGLGSGDTSGLSGAQQSVFVRRPLDGVYNVAPVRGFVRWNSHAFNLTRKDTTIEQWVNVRYVTQPNQRWLSQSIFNTSRIFAMGSIAPYTEREVCMSFTLPRYSRLTSLSSHMHQRGKFFRIWGPPQTPCTGGNLGNADPDCLPPDEPPMYLNRLYDDPLYLYYDPPREYNQGGAANRTFIACNVYDNGVDKPVRRHSTGLVSNVCGDNCGCPEAQRSCVSADVEVRGTPCNGDDAVCGEGGVCDACPVTGGVTTDDEMFIPLGSYFVQPPG